MTEHIKSIDYTNWDSKFKQIAEKSDTDGIKGLQGKEIIDFTSEAIKEKLEKSEIFELMGVSIHSSTRAAVARANGRTYSDEFNEARKIYNNELTPDQRHKITERTYEIGYERLHTMEKAIDDAYIACQVYQDINVATRPMRPYYRYYPTYNELINFDIEDLRRMTTEDMNSLNELRKNVQKAIDEAGGAESPTDAKQTEYDVDEIAKKFLPSQYKTYQEFADANRAILEKCKTADPTNMTPEEHEVYSIARNYAKEMLNITINEARTARWDTGEQLQAETSKFLDDMWDISNFEYETITDEGLEQIDSDIMFKSFEDAMTKDSETGVKVLRASKENRVKKILVNGHYELHHPDGRVYDTDGRRLK